MHSGAASSGPSWGAFAAAAPDLAAHAAHALYRGEAIAGAFLATVSRAGTPRLHPVSPVLAHDALWVFIVEMSPKYQDLLANGRFALHALPPAGGGEELAVQGKAHRVDDAATRNRVVAATGGVQGVHAFEQLFCCELTTVLHTRWDGWGTANAWPRHEKWRAGERAG
jgi:hypothetical protein